MRQLAAGGGVLLISMVSPMAGASMVGDLLRGYFNKRSFERTRFLNDLNNLQKRELIDYKESKGGNVQITITKAGRQKMLSYDIDNIHLKKTGRWDRKWRLIIFDVPVAQKQARDAFGRKLRSMSFYPLQKSVYITPYPCEDEIEFLAMIFDVRRHVLILHISDFEGEEKLIRYFGL
jgi:DNA-binding transcriptional regulator PaaX